MADGDMIELMGLVNDLIQCLPEVRAMELLMSLREGKSPLASEIKTNMAKIAADSSHTEEAEMVDQAVRIVGVDHQLVDLIAEGKRLLTRLSEEEIFNLLIALRSGGSPIAAAVREATTWRDEESSDQAGALDAKEDNGTGDVG
eukprot:704960-Rhodomonas_salina.1